MLHLNKINQLHKDSLLNLIKIRYWIRLFGKKIKINNLLIIIILIITISKEIHSRLQIL